MTIVLVGVVLVLAVWLIVWGSWPRRTVEPVKPTPAEPLTASKPLTVAERRESANAASAYLERMQRDEQAYMASFRGTGNEGSSVLRGYNPKYGTGDAGKL